MSPFDLIRGADGMISLTKLAAATFHLLLAVTVGYITWQSQEFNSEMWWMYSTFAVGHAVIDRTSARIAEFKSKKLDHDKPVSTTTTSTTVVQPTNAATVETTTTQPA